MLMQHNPNYDFSIALAVLIEANKLPQILFCEDPHLLEIPG